MTEQEWAEFLQSKIDEARAIERLKHDRRAWFDPDAKVNNKSATTSDLLPRNLSGLLK